MAAVNADRELAKVEATLDKLNKEYKLASMMVKRHESKASAATFTGYTDAEQQEYAKYCGLLKTHPELIQKQQQLAEALKASKSAKAVFKTALVGEEGDDGCYYYDDEDQFLDMMYGGEEGEELDDEEEWLNKEEKDEMAAFATVTDQLKKLGFDPATFTPAAAPASSTTHTGPLLPHEIKERSGSDNDILRYAKFGAIEAFRNEENIEGIDLKTFRDNNKRSCLHYAADGGNAELVKYLTYERRLSPAQEDDKGLTPLAIAVILQRKECVEIMAEYLRTEEKSFVASALLDPARQSMAHIPNPPRFIMSKGAPALPPNTRHNFWGTHQSTTIDGIGPVDVNAPEFNAAGVLKFLSSADAAVANSYYSWLSPVHAGLLQSMPNATFGVYSPNCDVIGMATLLVGATLLGGPDRRPVSNACALVGNVAISPGYRKGTDASTILGLTRTTLLNKGAKVGIFSTPAAGPAQTSTPICRVKWYRRTINTIQLIDNTTPTIARELYPDFIKYDATLRIDSHLKSLFKDSNQLALEWVNVKQQDPAVAVEYAKAIIKLMDSELGKQSECHLLFDGANELIDLLLKANEVYVVGTPTTITDVVIFAARTSRDKAADGVTAVANAAIHVFSLFSSLKDDARLLEMTKVAGSLMGAEVFYASNTHGYSEDNFRAAMFEEQSAYGTNLFVMGDDFRTAMPKTDAKKVFIPFAAM